MTTRAEILESIQSVPAMPTAAAKVITMIQDPDVGIQELMQVIEYDPGLTSNVLRLANSAYFAGPRSIASLRDAGVRLGMNRIFQLVMASTVSRIARHAIKGYDMPAGGLLEHAIAVAIGTEILAEAVGKEAGPHVFTAGLLHDIGKIVLGTFVEIDAKPILDLAFQGEVSFEQAEQRVLGIDHPEVGAILLESWSLPLNIVEPVRFHHRPLDMAGDALSADLIHIADHLCLEAGLGMGIDGLNYRPEPAVMDRLGLKPLAVEGVMCRIIEELDELRSLVGEP